MNKTEIEFLKAQNEELIRAIRELAGEKVMLQMQLKQHRVSHHSKNLDSVEMDYTPSKLSSKPIKTQAQALEDILYQSGQIARDSWEALKGFEYDKDVTDNEDAAFRDSEISEEFQQSELASYFTRKPIEQVARDLDKDPQGSHQANTANTSDKGDATQPTQTKDKSTIDTSNAWDEGAIGSGSGRW